MLPNVPQPGQSQPPASLPAVPMQSPMSPAPGAGVPGVSAPVAVPAPGGVTAMPGVDGVPMHVPDASMDQVEATALQARMLMQRYAGSPFELSQAFGQLKAGYLARQHNITPNSTGN